MVGNFCDRRNENEKMKQTHVSNYYEIITGHSELKDKIESALNQIQDRIAKLDNNEAYFQLESVISFNIKIAKNNPLKGSSYVELPKIIQSKKSCN